MSRVVFKDVVKRINVNVDRHNTERSYYVGGEHIDSCELLVTKHGLIEGSTIGFKFHFGFEPGHILFMSRNPHLRKASMATFSGICSDSTYVVETRDENVLLQKYLLLEMQSDRFWEWAEANKSGGVNYLINYKTLDSYEFDLPSLEEQKVLAEKLWAAYEVKLSYLKMIEATENMVKSQFIEMFGLNKEYPKDTAILTMKEVASKLFAGGDKPSDYSDSPNEIYRYPIIANGVGEAGVIGYCKEPRVVEDALTISARGTIGYCAIRKAGFLPVVRLITLVPNNRVLLPYLKFYFENVGFESTGAVQGQLTIPSIKEKKIVVPPLEIQKQFCTIVEQADKSGFELRKSIDAIDAVIKSLINS